ncbi:hypothetical protein PVAP13_5NG075100 [Panicum virgatum]|uniref:G-patch domain-containing protein n=2 Tax=Panicum virgatum TaxID=38727 RepID=A0A8T0RKJ8_PANVG|nr:hypothetical protein PVAP13_5NG075100 [Panicum virgatum]
MSGERRRWRAAAAARRQSGPSNRSDGGSGAAGRPYHVRRTAAMEGSGGGAAAEGAGAGFEWDADSQLYHHASTGFYHDPVAGWYYSSRDGQYYIYENGSYMPLTTDLGNEPTSKYPYDEASQDVWEISCLEQPTPDDENERVGPPSEWMEETLINLYLSGYSNREVIAESSLGNTHINEEDRNETTGDKLSNLTSGSASASLNDASSQQVENERETKNSTDVDESLGEGKLYRLRNPGRKYLASLSAYDSSNPTKDWGFPDIYANPDINLNKQSTAQYQSEVADESSIEGGISTANGKEQKTKVYRDRAAERRNLHRGLGIGPGQKQSNIISSDEYEGIDDIDSMGTASVDMNFRSSGLHSAKRIMENMGWKEGEGLGKSRRGIVELIQPLINKHGTGLGWNQTR